MLFKVKTKVCLRKTSGDMIFFFLVRLFKYRFVAEMNFVEYYSLIFLQCSYFHKLVFAVRFYVDYGACISHLCLTSSIVVADCNSLLSQEFFSLWSLNYLC